MRNKFYNGFDTERISGKEIQGDYRSSFQIDRDRVLHTPTFRRLQNKTQVFWSGEYDFYRTRLTHSLEVAQIGKAISTWLLRCDNSLLSDDFRIDSDLIEAICLSHDLGHPPFGHAGERTLNHLMQEYGGFEGNAQTLRLLTDLIFSKSHSGMDPTRAFLDGVLKYKSLWSELKKDNKPPKNHFIYDPQHAHLDWSMGGNDFPIELSPGDSRDSFKSIECQIMDWADDTAYSLNDLSDSVKAGFLHVQNIEVWAEQQELSDAETTSINELIKAVRNDKIEPFVGSRIGRYIKAAKLTEDVNILSSTTNRYRYRLMVEDAVKAESQIFKRLAYDIVFLSPQLKQLEYKGSSMLRQLWDILETRYIRGEKIDGQDFQLLPKNTFAKVSAVKTREEKARLICDYLAGMTDGYAGRTFKRLFSPDFGSINDI